MDSLVRQVRNAETRFARRGYNQSNLFYLGSTKSTHFGSGEYDQRIDKRSPVIEPLRAREARPRDVRFERECRREGLRDSVGSGMILPIGDLAGAHLQHGDLSVAL